MRDITLQGNFVCTIAGRALVVEQYLFPNEDYFQMEKPTLRPPLRKPIQTVNLHRKRRKQAIAVCRLSFILGEAFCFLLICTEQVPNKNSQQKILAKVPHKKSNPKFPTQVFNKSSQQKKKKNRVQIIIYFRRRLFLFVMHRTKSHSLKN